MFGKIQGLIDRYLIPPNHLKFIGRKLESHIIWDLFLNRQSLSARTGLNRSIFDNLVEFSYDLQWLSQLSPSPHLKRWIKILIH